MALADVRLSILAFPQRWTGNSLEARVLLLPTGDPTVAPLPPSGLPAFAGTSWALRAMVVPGLDSLAGPDPGATPGTQVFAFTANAPADALSLFNALGAQYPIAAPKPQPQRQARAGVEFRKHLPASYTSAFAFERPGPGTTTGTEFGCALRDTPVGTLDDEKPDATITWGAVLSFALRQPLLARALGLLHDVMIPLAPPTLLNAGGWLFVELNPAGPIVLSNKDAVRRYAARMPALDATARPLFAAVLLPVSLTTGEYDDAMAESAIYDDGFGKIVHAAQAVTVDAASGTHDMLPPASDAGIDLGWDDEQITLWFNRQLEALRVRVGLPGTAIEAPLGVSGYRIDVRMPDDPAHGAFESLCRAFSIDTNGAPAPLRFPPPPAAAVFTANFDGELAVEPSPAQSTHATDNLAWLPQHFTRWQDGSLVVNDRTLFQIAGASPNDANDHPIDVPPPTYGAPPPAIRLRYGNRYEFRCRFVDLTGGGPSVDDVPRNPAPHPTAEAPFLRHVQPKAVRLKTNIKRPPPTKVPPAVGTVTKIDVWRPLIGYPEMVFAGIDDPGVIAQVINSAGAAHDAGDAVGVNDPDVTDLLVTVEVRATAHDPGPDPDKLRDGEFRKLYDTKLAFPPFDPADVLNPGPPLTLKLDYLDVADVAKLAPPGLGLATLPVPRARDVRLRLTPHCADKPKYFGDESTGLNIDVRNGLTVDVATRAPAQSEAGLFGTQAPEIELNGIMLQPAADMVIRLAEHLDLAADGLTLSARPGERVVFGVSAALRHVLSGDYGSLTFASEGELLGHWIAVMRLDLARDWTWDGLDDEGFVVSRRDLPADPLREVGAVQVPFVVSSIAVSGSDQPGIDRRSGTRLVLFDAVDPQPNAGQFPTLKTPEWIVEPRLRGFSAAANAALARSFSIRLPVAAPPRQTPKLVSAGIALSPYQRDKKAYTSTQPRQRVLWFEFAEPVADPNDALFARVTAYGPDPLLSGAITHLLVPAPAIPIGPTTWFDFIESLLPTPAAPPALAIDPEPIRIIVPGQPEDSSGLDAMAEMEAAIPPPPATQARHYMVPLPPAIAPDAPDLFGFWTYELRIGHKKIWSTAQARFGRPLEVKGVQHPPPAMTCTAFRFREADTAPRRIVAMAPHATAVFQDKRLTDPAGANDPRTRIWVLLYAQVMQADGATRRNVLIARAPAIPQFDTVDGKPIPPQTRDVIGVAQFDEPSITQKLADLALPADSPLSVLAVELLPSDRLVQQTITIGDAQVYLTVDQPDPFAGSQQSAFAEFIASVPQASDPLGRELGTITSRRILRCSPLTPLAPAC